MTIVRQAATATLLVLLASIAPSRAERPRDFDPSSDWRPLFDGRTLDGWEHVGPGQVRGRRRTPPHRGGHGPALVFARKARQLHHPGRLQDRGDAPTPGLHPDRRRPKDPWFAVHHGFEVQIADQGAEGRGTGSIYTFSKAAAKPSKPGEWNTLEITLKGNRIITTINGVQVTDFDSSDLKPESPEKTGEGDPRAALDPSRATSACKITTRTPSSTSRTYRFGHS